MEATDSRSELRGAVFRGDHETLIALLQANWVDDALQLAGDGLVAAVRAECAGAAELARRCAASLRERDWDGDAELVSSLETSLGIGAGPSLRQLPVDLEELSMILEGDPVSGGGRIDLETGEVWPQPALDYAEEMGELDSEDEDDDRWLWVSSEGSRAGYRDMEWFIADMGDSALARRLEHAIRGRGAFRRFKVARPPIRNWLIAGMRSVRNAIAAGLVPGWPTRDTRRQSCEFHLGARVARAGNEPGPTSFAFWGVESGVLSRFLFGVDA